MMLDSVQSFIVLRATVHFAPSALPGFNQMLPGALPQAVTFRAVGPETPHTRRKLGRVESRRNCCLAAVRHQILDPSNHHLVITRITPAYYLGWIRVVLVLR